LTRPSAIPLAALALLAACGTPQEQCIARETRDLRVVERLIAEAEANIARGYALEERVFYSDRWTYCPVPPDPDAPPDAPVPPPKPCLEEVRETRTVPKAINLADETDKLSGLKVKRRDLARAAEPGIAACRRTYPE
jgi:hypothetical protein